MEFIEEQINKAIKYQNIAYITFDRNNINKVKYAKKVIAKIMKNNNNKQLPMLFKINVFINDLVYKQDVKQAISTIRNKA